MNEKHFSLCNDDFAKNKKNLENSFHCKLIAILRLK